MSTEATTPNFAEKMMIDVLTYYTPVLIFFGTIGNFLSVYVLFQSDLRRSSSSFYLAALAISDTGFLICVLVPYWLEIVGIHIFSRTGYCQSFVYLLTLCSSLSVWFVVAFTVERFVAVRYPLHRQSMCTVARAKTILAGLTSLGPVLCSPVLWMATPRDSVWGVPGCTVIDEWEDWAFAFVVSNTVVAFVLPFTIIAVLNGLIAKTVRRQAGLRMTLTNSPRRNNEKSSCQQSSSASVSQTKITKMLLIVSSVFLCLNLPSYTMRLYSFCQNEELPRTLHLVQQICDLVFETSFGINFFLYCAGGHNFRQAVLGMMVCLPRSWRATKMRLSLRRSQLNTSTKSTTSSGGCLTPQSALVLEMPPEASCELRDLSNDENSQKSKNPSNRYSFDKH